MVDAFWEEHLSTINLVIPRVYFKIDRKHRLLFYFLFLLTFCNDTSQGFGVYFIGK